VRNSALVRLIINTVAALVLFCPARATTYITPWGHQVMTTGPFQVRLNYTDKNGQAQSGDITQLPATAFGGLPGSLQKLKSLPLLGSPNGGNYFDGVWSKIRGQVCADVKAMIATQENFSPNTAYNIRCNTNPRGVLETTFETNWENDQFQYVSGRRIAYVYYVPLNSAVFYMTTPTTCHAGGNCGIQPVDPQFTVTFDVSIAVTSTSAGQTAFILPVTNTESASVTPQSVDGGDITGGLVTATQKWALALPAEAAAIIASDGAIGLSQLATSTAKLLADAIATITGIIVDQHLRDEVSAHLNLGSAAAGGAALNASSQFDQLFQGLYNAQLSGMQSFGIGAGSDGSFEFAFTYPQPAKPVVTNTIASSNGGKLFAPTISPQQSSEVAPGAQLALDAQYFSPSYTNFLQVGWTKTVQGTPVSQLTWGPQGQSLQSQQITGLGFTAKSLQPNTAYQFEVQECDGLSCSPWSDSLITRTESSGSNTVKFWLDNNSSVLIGTAQIAPQGAEFTANVTIPSSTSPGQHTVNAAVSGQNSTSTTIIVCQTTGCSPTLGVVNDMSGNGALYPPSPPARVEDGNYVTVRGGNFDAGQSVTIYVDSSSGPQAGTATVGADGTFQTTFTMPLVIGGDHTLVAIEAGGTPFHYYMRKRATQRAQARQAKSQSLIFKGPPYPIPYPIGFPTQASIEVYVDPQAQ
jgi:hypothetical protein